MVSMKRDYFQIISNVAVIAGLAVLVYEVQESNTRAVASGVLEVSKTWSNRQLALMGDNPSAALAKAMSDPVNLTPEEAVIVEAYHSHVLAEFWQQAAIANLHLNLDVWVDESVIGVHKYLGYPLGRAWWDVVRPTMPQTEDAQAVVRVFDLGLSRPGNLRAPLFEIHKSLALDNVD